MPHQFQREPLTRDETNRLANACMEHKEKLVVWPLLEIPGSEFLCSPCSLRIVLNGSPTAFGIYGKGGPHGTKGKFYIV